VQITVTDFVAGAAAARGAAVIIDVFRACSVQAYALAQSAQCVFPVAAVEEARRLKREHPDWLLVGERHARKLPDFDLGNSPSEIAALALGGRSVIHTTHAGTQGLTGARSADIVLTGALVNASATARHIRALQPDSVTIVRMGHEARERSVEDDICAELLCARLRDEPYDVAGIAARLRAAPSAAKFFDPVMDWAPVADFARCAAVDRFDFVVRLMARDTALPYLQIAA
jgi:2-phosphosulfolactate phosphatase